MINRLNFVCPTDHLDVVINQKFKGVNYFFTSLGNSVSLEKKVVNDIASLLKTKHITDINFVLCDDNQIVLDAINDQDHCKVRGLSSFYQNIIQLLKETEVVYEPKNHTILLLSHFLNTKINELSIIIDQLINEEIKIRGWIYLSESKTFEAVYPELVYSEKHSLN